MRYTLLDPDGAPVFEGNWTDDVYDPGRLTLATGGDYTLVFDGQNEAVQDYAFAIYTVPAESEEAISVPTAPEGIQGRISTPGEIDRYTFEAEAGTELYFDSLSGNTDVRYALLDPDGAMIFEDNWTNDIYDAGAYTLETTGTYTLVFDGRNTAVQDYAFAVIPPGE